MLDCLSMLNGLGPESFVGKAPETSPSSVIPAKPLRSGPDPQDVLEYAQYLRNAAVPVPRSLLSAAELGIAPARAPRGPQLPSNPNERRIVVAIKRHDQLVKALKMKCDSIIRNGCINEAVEDLARGIQDDPVCGEVWQKLVLSLPANLENVARSLQHVIDSDPLDRPKICGWISMGQFAKDPQALLALSEALTSQIAAVQPWLQSDKARAVFVELLRAAVA